MDKTAVVETIDRVRHRRYAKTVQRNKKLHVHDENTLNIGDRACPGDSPAVEEQALAARRDPGAAK